MWRIAGAAAVQMQEPDDGDLANALGALRLLELSVSEARIATVDAMRARRHSWSEIGDALGISRQAAQQRYHRKDEDEPTTSQKRPGAGLPSDVEPLGDSNAPRPRSDRGADEGVASTEAGAPILPPM